MKLPRIQFRLRTLLVAVVIVATIGCGQGSNPQSTGPASQTSGDMKVDKDDRIERLVKQISLCPGWTQMTVGDELTKQGALKRLDDIAKNDTALIRKAVERFQRHEQNPHYSIDELSKLFLLNRYLFKIPSKSQMQAARFFGGWGGVPHDETDVDLLWPFAVNSAGKLELVGEFRGYNGHMFEAVEEFDYFNQRFGRRER